MMMMAVTTTAAIVTNTMLMMMVMLTNAGRRRSGRIVLTILAILARNLRLPFLVLGIHGNRCGGRSGRRQTVAVVRQKTVRNGVRGGRRCAGRTVMVLRIVAADALQPVLMEEIVGDARIEIGGVMNGGGCHVDVVGARCVR